MAFIQRKGEAYTVRWRDPDGRERRGTCPDRKTANLLLGEVERRLALGLPGRVEAENPFPAEEAIAAYLDWIAANGSDASVQTLECTLTQFVGWASKGRSRFYMSDLDHRLIEDWLVELAKGDRVGQRTRVGYARRVSRLWQWAARRYPGRVAPHVAPELPRVHATKQSAPSWAEMDACVTAARKGAAYVHREDFEPGWTGRLATILRYTGLRIRQAWLLRRDDFDLKAGILHVRAEDEKTRVGRIIPISPHLVSYLREVELPDGRLFQRAMAPEAAWINRCWRAGQVRAAIHGWHAFRRGFETGLLAGGVDLVRVRALVGHSSGVDDSYIDAAGLDLRAAVKRIPAVEERVSNGATDATCVPGDAEGRASSGPRTDPGAGR